MYLRGQSGLIKLLILISIWLLLAGSAFAQKFNFRNYFTSDGLSDNIIFSLFQDSSGRLWIGTADGLNCYDGLSFKKFNKPDGLSGNRVYQIIQIAPNTLLVATSEGLDQIELKDGKEIIKPFGPSDRPKLGSVQAILIDQDGSYYIGSSVGLFRYYNGAFENLNEKYRLQTHEINAELIDNHHQLWLGNRTDLIVIDLNQPTGNPRHFQLDTPDSCRSLFQDRAGNIWATFQEHGLGRFSGDQNQIKFQFYNLDTGLPSNTCYRVLQDRDGYYWLATMNGVVKFNFSNPDKFTILQIYQEQNGLAQNIILPIFIDREGSLWFGSHHGLSKLSSERFVNYDNQTGLTAKVVNCVMEDHDGDIWAGLYQGINLLSRGQIYNVELTPKPEYGFNALFQDHTGTVWASGQDLGLYRITKQKQPDGHYRIEGKIININNRTINAYAFIEDKFQRLWIATNHGLFSYDGAKLTEYHKADGINSDLIYTLNLIDDDHIWLGTHAGVTLLELLSDRSVKFGQLSGVEGQLPKVVGQIIKDSQGYLWFCTDGDGVFKLADNKFINYNSNKGLSNNVVYSMLEQPAGTFWFGTNNGLDRLRNGQFTNFSYQDGFSQKGARVNQIIFDRAGNLWTATDEGLCRYNAGLDYPSLAPPKLSLAQIKIDQTALTGNLQSELLNGHQLSFAYNQNNWQFEFLAISFIDEQAVSYQYQLIGFDKDWSTVSNIRSTKYPNLLPGNYTFQVRAFNRAGMVSEISSISFQIRKPFWWQSWFLLLSSLLIATMIYTSYRLRIRVIEAKNLKLEQMIKERTAEVVAQKDQLEQKNLLLNQKNQELIQSKEDLIQSHKQAEKIFAALSDALPGTVLDGKYQLDEKIGAGGFGAVYRATHLAMRRAVAIKVFRPMPGNESMESLERFQLEAISACRINHPNAVAVLDSGISAGNIAYLVMELLQGHSLAEELRETPILSPHRAAKILLPACDVLAKAHATGVVHRDIKPDNIFLHQTPEGEVVKIVDFGIAKLITETDSLDIHSLTKAGELLGTPAYMSPERLADKPYDGRSDVYSLGVLLYRMLCGRLPFQTEDGGLWALVLMQVKNEPPDPQSINPKIPDDIATLILRALSKDPVARPTAKEFAIDLTQAIELASEELTADGKPIRLTRIDSSLTTQKVNLTTGKQSKPLANTMNDSLDQEITLIKPGSNEEEITRE